MSIDSQVAMFSRIFRVVEARTPHLRLEAFRLRYQVYCVENAFEDPSQHIGGLETDIYDEHSAHALLIHETSGQVCGCVRLILPGRAQALPSRALLTPATQNLFDKYPAATTAEVSRYAVSKAFRRRAGESMYPDVAFSDTRSFDERRLLPHITLGLMTAVARLSVSHGMTHLCAVMAPALLRLLRKFGMEFEPVGPCVEYHGLRQPCIAAAADLLAGVQSRQSSYFDILREECGTEPQARPR